MASGPFRGGQDMISPVFHVHRPRPWTSSHAFALPSSSAPLRCYRICYQSINAGLVHFKVHQSKPIALSISHLTSKRCTAEVQIFGGEADGRGSGGLPPVAPGGSREAAGVKECGARRRRIPLGVYIENARPTAWHFRSPK